MLAAVLYFVATSFFMFADEITSLVSVGLGIASFVFSTGLVISPPEFGEILIKFI